MRDVILPVSVIIFMMIGYFFVGRIDKFFSKNYKGFDDEKDEDENSPQGGKNDRNPLRKVR